MRLAAIHVFPLKGARGVSLERAEVLAGGLRHDRRFMLVGDDGRFLSQRTSPALALVTTALVRGPDGATSLAIGVPGSAPAMVKLPPDVASLPRRRVGIWHDEVEAVVVPSPVVEQLEAHLGQRCSLVFMPDEVVRPVELPYGAPGDRVGFADGYPLLLAKTASLADLNARLAEPVPIDRFRANLVVEGGRAFDEEQHPRVRVGAVTFRMAKRCARCQVITIDQASAAVGREPLATLASYRAEDGKVYFAMNLIPDREGAIATGDEVAYID